MRLKNLFIFLAHFTNPELHKAWGIKDPLDAPVKAFGVENLAGIAKKIKQAFGDGKKTKEKLKN